MAQLKQLDRSAIVAYSPNAPLLAAGTVAGAIDMSFSTNSVLEIYALDFSTPSDSLTLAGSLPVPERFNRLAWGGKPSETLPLTHGILAGGLADGSVCVWDPAVILDKSAGKPALLAKQQKHTAAVKGLMFNSFMPHLLASGGADGELWIWDLSSPTQPSLFPSLKGGAGAPGSDAEITYLAWNPRVQQILASTSTSGATTVWDLKKQKPVLSLKDNSHRRGSVLQWNPDVATQLIVASDDDRCPTLQLWDLRNHVSPLKEFVGHTKGVLGMAWCHQDPSLLLTSGKDNRTICWDVQSSDPLTELPQSANWNFDLQWCPVIPGVFSAASFDGKVGLYNVAACSNTTYAESMDANMNVQRIVTGSTPLKRAPAWMRRPCSVCFGFGGRLASVVNTKHQAADHTGAVRTSESATVTISQVVTEGELVNRSEAFERAISGGDKGTLKDYCSAKASTVDLEESETWSFLSVLFEEDARRQLLARLGFADALPSGVQAGSFSAQADTLAAAVDGMNMADGHGKAAPEPATAPEDFFEQAGESFFDNLPDQPLVSHSSNVSDGTNEVATTHVAGLDDHAAGEDAEAEEDIQRALFVGNHEAAVEACMRANRVADALLIANICSADLYKRTMHRYMKRSPRPYMRLINAMVDGDYMSLVKTRPVAAWKETLAMLAAYVSADQWASLCEALAGRLAGAGMNHAATLCYICAGSDGSMEQCVSHWSRAARGPAASVDSTQSVIEKAVIMGMAMPSGKKASAALSELLTTYSATLASQGKMSNALEYLEMVPGEASSMVAILRDRIYRSGAPGLPANMNPPPFPFVLMEVQPAPAPAPMQVQQPAANPNANIYGNGTNTNYGYPNPAPSPYPNQPGNYTPTPPAYPTNYPATNAPAYPNQPTSYPPTINNPYPTNPAAPYSSPNPYPPTSGYPSAAPTSGYPQAAGGPVQYPVTASPPQQPAPPAPPTGGPSVYQVSKPSPGSRAPSLSKGPSGDQLYNAGQQQAAAAPAVPAAVPNQFMQVQQQVQQQPTTTQTVPTGTQFRPVHMTNTPTVPLVTPTPPAQPPQGPLGGQPTMGGPPPPPRHPAPPSAPAGPPANVSLQSVDTSHIPGDQRPIVASITNLYNACNTNPAKKREMEDNSKRMGVLCWKLNAGQVSPGVVAKLQQLCRALDAGDLASASNMQVDMANTDWDECNHWLTALKRLIKTRQVMLGQAH